MVKEEKDAQMAQGDVTPDMTQSLNKFLMADRTKQPDSRYGLSLLRQAGCVSW